VNSTLLFRARHLPYFEAKGDVFTHIHVLEQRVVLEHEPHLPFARVNMIDPLATEFDAAGVSFLQARDDAQDRAFATARRPQKSNQFTVCDLEVDPIDCRKRAEVFDEASDTDCHSTVPCAGP
jgi:hypothetical protein